MMSVWTEAYGVDKAGEMIADLSDDIVATGDGFKIGASAGMDYAESLTNITKEAIITKIALLELKIAEGDLSEEEQANAKATIAYLKQYYSYIDAQQKKTIQDGLIKDLEKAKEKADKLVDSLKALVDWLRGYDRYANLDGVISTLEEDFFLRTADYLVPVEVKSTNGRSKSLRTLIESEHYPDIKFGIKLVNGNIGFMGYAMILTLFGNAGMFYASAYNLVFNIVFWSVCIGYLNQESDNN